MTFSALVTIVFVVAAAGVDAPRLAEMRMTPAEVLVPSAGDGTAGSSGLAGIHTKVLFGNPEAAGFYSILLFVPAETSIAAHSHRDDRVATVVSGTWQFGYGDHFDAKLLKMLPPGSVYSEPGGDNHFARTGHEAVVVQISGYGPTSTRYFNPKDDPAAAKK